MIVTTPTTELILSDFTSGASLASSKPALAIAANGARKLLTAINLGTTAIYLGDSGVNSENYLHLIPPGKLIVVETDYSGEFWAVCNSGEPIFFFFGDYF